MKPIFSNAMLLHYLYLTFETHNIEVQKGRRRGDLNKSEGGERGRKFFQKIISKGGLFTEDLRVL